MNFIFKVLWFFLYIPRFTPYFPICPSIISLSRVFFIVPDPRPNQHQFEPALPPPLRSPHHRHPSNRHHFPTKTRQPARCRTQLLVTKSLSKPLSGTSTPSLFSSDFSPVRRLFDVPLASLFSPCQDEPNPVLYSAFGAVWSSSENRRALASSLFRRVWRCSAPR